MEYKTGEQQTRSSTFKLRLSPDELELFRSGAAKMGVSIADYIRLSVKAFAKPKPLDY